MPNLRALARGKPCQVRLPGVCCGDPMSTVLAHFRLSGYSGIGYKSPDLLGAWACFQCHSYVDTHHDDATRLAFALGVMRTQGELIRLGLIPW